MKMNQDEHGFPNELRCITDLVQKLVENHDLTLTTYDFEKEESEKMSEKGRSNCISPITLQEEHDYLHDRSVDNKSEEDERSICTQPFIEE